jgi:hypothetical protein
MISHLADLMRARGDTDGLQSRRAEAIAVLADPAAACLLLVHHKGPISGAPRPVTGTGSTLTAPPRSDAGSPRPSDNAR